MMLRIAIFFVLPVLVFGQEASLTLGGTVVLSTGEPLAHALVTLYGFVSQPQSPDPGGKKSQMIQKSALTDATGGFHFFALPVSQYSVTAQKPGFQPDFSPASRTTRVDLKSSTDSVRVVLTPLGVVTGTVTDQFDQPMRGVSIVALASNVVEGLRQTRTIQTVLTDDRGMWRMGELGPGKYYFKATGQGGSTILPGGAGSLRNDIGDSFAPVYSGGAVTMAAATPVEVTGGSHAAADFHLKLQPAWRVGGVLHNYTPNQQFTFSIEVAGEEVAAGPDRFSASTGAFEFKDVVDGSYILRVKQDNKSGEVSFRVDGADPSPVTLTLYPAVDIPVHVQFTNAAPPSTPLQPRRDCFISVSADGFGELKTTDTPTDGGSLHDVAIGAHRISFRCFAVYVRSAFIGTQDLLVDPILRIEPDSIPPPIDILLTYGGGTLKGRTDDSAVGRPLWYLLIPQFSSSGGPVVTAGQSGTEFVFGHLAPGGYTLYAFARPDIEFRNPAFLQSVTGGLSVQIEDGKEQEVVVKEVIQ